MRIPKPAPTRADRKKQQPHPAHFPSELLGLAEQYRLHSRMRPKGRPFGIIFWPVHHSTGHAAPVGRFSGPIGFDGHYRVGGRMPYGPSAARGAWLDDGTSLVLEVQTLGNDDAARVTLVFGDKTVELSYQSAGGFRAKMQGRVDD